MRSVFVLVYDIYHQWFKNFHDTTGAVEGYDAVERRSKGRGGAKYGGGGARYGHVIRLYVPACRF